MAVFRPVGLVASAVFAGLFGAACGSAETTSTGTPEAGCAAVDPDGGGGTPPPPNGPSLCAPGACNYQTQEGCGEGETCRPELDEASRSVAPVCKAPDDKGALAPCSDWTTDCGRGLFCFEGLCRKTCCGGDWSACAPDESCLRTLYVRVGMEEIPAGFDLCVSRDTCDILDPESCADQGRVCRIVDPTGAVGCAPPSDRAPGDPCDADRQCGPVQHCVAGACRRLCRAEACGEPSCPPEEGMCVHFDRDPPGVGECTPDWVVL